MDKHVVRTYETQNREMDTEYELCKCRESFKDREDESTNIG